MAAPASLSDAERSFIVESMTENVRIDGRTRVDYRYFSVELAPITHANGSARVKLGQTEVLVVCNVELNETQSDRGEIRCSVDW